MGSEIVILGTSILTLIFACLTFIIEDQPYFEMLFLALTILMAVATTASMLSVVAGSYASYLGIIRGIYTTVSWGSVLVFFFVIVGIFKQAMEAWGK